MNNEYRTELTGKPAPGATAAPPARPGAPRNEPARVISGKNSAADPTALRRAYHRCRQTAAAHGRTYYLATRLLSAEQRPAVHALYAFARMVDDIVDAPDRALSGPGPAAVLDAVELTLRTAWSLPAEIPRTGTVRPAALPAGFGDIVLALTDTVDRFAVDPHHFWLFLDSMRMDAADSPLFRNRYPDMTALHEYMRGSAAAIGLQLLPVLGTTGPRAAAEPAAAALGNAFQLTNFLRDIGEDLDRDRIYLPADELAAFGVDEQLLTHCHRTRRTDRRVRRALQHLIAVNRDLYRGAHPGIELLSPRVRPAIRTAAAVYAAILDRIEENDYDVFARRAVVPNHRRLRLVAGAALLRRRPLGHAR
ncbi:phytoene/squalene synthase family protein [Nocardia sp. NPDC051750]|uniref:phytoene/squalene synthase family protein n=1 Tax=Nocardia sp. NPDC051750 TaxID=3364325 RepID=UPI0037B9E7C8